MIATKIKSGTAYSYNNAPVWIEHDRQDGSVVVCYQQSRKVTDSFDVVSVDDLKPVVKVGKALPKESKGRAAENKQYLALRKVYLENHLVCEANISGCTRKATEVHHAAGRIGKRLIDVSTFVPLCGNCHRWVENNATQAKEMGLSVNRL